MKCVAPFATQIFLVGMLIFFERLDGFVLPCPASNLYCKRDTNSPSYYNDHIWETIGNSVEFLRSSVLKLWSRLTKSTPHKRLGETHENLLKKLYKSSNVLQVALKAKINKKEKTQALELQKDLNTEILEVSRDISSMTKSYLEGLKNDQNMVKRNHWLQKNQKREDVGVRLPTKEQVLAKNTGKLAEDQLKHNSGAMAEKQWKLAGWQVPLATKAKIAGKKEKTHVLQIQKEVATEISEASGEITLRSIRLEYLKSHQKTLQEVQVVGKTIREEDLFLQLVIKRQRLQRTKGTPTEEQIKSASHKMEEKWSKMARRLFPLKNNKKSQVLTKAKLTENKEKTHELEVQREVATKISEASGDISLSVKSPMEKLKMNQTMAQKVHELGNKPSDKDFFAKFLTKRRGFANAPVGLSAERELASYSVAEDTGKPAVLLNPQQFSSTKSLPQAPIHSLRKRSILHLPTELPPLTNTIGVDDDSEEEPDKVNLILESGNRSTRPNRGKHLMVDQQLKEKNPQNEQRAEKLLEKELELPKSRRDNLLRRLIFEGNYPRITWNELFSDETFSNEVDWGYQEEATSAPPSSDFLSSTVNFREADAFEDPQKQMEDLISNQSLIKLIIQLFPNMPIVY